MSISSVTSKVIYVGDGTTRIFAYPFRILAVGDLTVTRYYEATGSTSILTLNTHYVVSGAGEDSGGNVTLTGSYVATNLPSGSKLVIAREMDLLQETDYVENDAFSAETHERALDRLTMISQQLKEFQDRSLAKAIIKTGGLIFPEPEGDKVIGWNSSADGLANKDNSTVLASNAAVACASSATVTVASQVASASSATVAVASQVASASSATVAVTSQVASASSGTVAVAQAAIAVSSGTVTVTQAAIAVSSGTVTVTNAAAAASSGTVAVASQVAAASSATVAVSMQSSASASQVAAASSATVAVDSATASLSSSIVSVSQGAIAVSSATVTVAQGAIAVSSATVAVSAQSSASTSQVAATSSATVAVNVQSSASANQVASASSAVVAVNAQSSASTSQVAATSSATVAVTAADTAATSYYRYYRVTIIDPATTYIVSPSICLLQSLNSAITITKLDVTCDANPATQLSGNLLYADAFIGTANPVAINDFNTTSGVHSDASIANGVVAVGKCIYLTFDAVPVSTIKVVNFNIKYQYN